jgi:hypothetical protein
VHGSALQVHRAGNWCKRRGLAKLPTRQAAIGARNVEPPHESMPRPRSNRCVILSDDQAWSTIGWFGPRQSPALRGQHVPDRTVDSSSVE